MTYRTDTPKRSPAIEHLHREVEKDMQSFYSAFKHLTDRTQPEALRLAELESINDELIAENAVLYESLAEVVESLKATWEPRPWKYDETPVGDWPEVIKAEELLARRP